MMHTQLAWQDCDSLCVEIGIGVTFPHETSTVLLNAFIDLTVLCIQTYLDLGRFVSNTVIIGIIPGISSMLEYFCAVSVIP